MHRYGGYWEEFEEEEMMAFRDEYIYSECLEDGTATMQDIDRVASEMMTYEFNPRKPLWRIQYCRKMASGQACIIFSASHAIGDGMSLVEACMRCTDPPEPAVEDGKKGEKKNE